MVTKVEGDQKDTMAHFLVIDIFDSPTNSEWEIGESLTLASEIIYNTSEFQPISQKSYRSKLNFVFKSIEQYISKASRISTP